MPDEVAPDRQVPVAVIFHDAGGSAVNLLSDEAMVRAFLNKGFAVLAPDALPRGNRRLLYSGHRPGSVEAADTIISARYLKKKFVLGNPDGSIRLLKFGRDRGWYFYNTDRMVYGGGIVGRERDSDYIGRDEIRTVSNLLAHAEENYGTERRPTLMIGMGHGASLVWQFACYAPKLAALYAPIGGAFWENIPKNCKVGARLVHTHQRTSEFWPLDGATGNKRRYKRTSVFRNLEMLLGANQCGPDATTDRNDELGVNHTTWADCIEGGPVEFMVLDEAFAFQTWWLDEILGRIEPSRLERPSEAPEVPLETGPEFKASGAGTGFKTPGTGTGFKTPGTGTGFKTPGTGEGSRFKPAK